MLLTRIAHSGVVTAQSCGSMVRSPFSPAPNSPARDSYAYVQEGLAASTLLLASCNTPNSLMALFATAAAAVAIGTGIALSRTFRSEPARRDREITTSEFDEILTEILEAKDPTTSEEDVKQERSFERITRLIHLQPELFLKYTGGLKRMRSLAAVFLKDWERHRFSYDREEVPREVIAFLFGAMSEEDRGPFLFEIGYTTRGEDELKGLFDPIVRSTDGAFRQKFAQTLLQRAESAAVGLGERVENLRLLSRVHPMLEVTEQVRTLSRLEGLLKDDTLSVGSGNKEWHHAADALVSAIRTLAPSEKTRWIFRYVDKVKAGGTELDYQLLVQMSHTPFGYLDSPGEERARVARLVAWLGEGNFRAVQVLHSMIPRELAMAEGWIVVRALVRFAMTGDIDGVIGHGSLMEAALGAIGKEEFFELAPKEAADPALLKLVTWVKRGLDFDALDFRGYVLAPKPEAYLDHMEARRRNEA